MGWLSGTPKWFDKIPADFRPDERQMERLEKLRKSILAEHDFFYTAYMNCPVITIRFMWHLYGKIAGKLFSSKPSEKEILREVFLSYVEEYRKTGRSNRYDDYEKDPRYLDEIDSMDYILKIVFLDFDSDRYRCFPFQMNNLIDLINAILKGERLRFADGEI